MSGAAAVGAGTCPGTEGEESVSAGPGPGGCSAARRTRDPSGAADSAGSRRGPRLVTLWRNRQRSAQATRPRVRLAGCLQTTRPPFHPRDRPQQPALGLPCAQLRRPAHGHSRRGAAWWHSSCHPPHMVASCEPARLPPRDQPCPPAELHRRRKASWAWENVQLLTRQYYLIYT